jgi:dihydropteroate synthase
MNFSKTHLSICVRGQLKTFERPQVMGILNVTPDSFFDGGRYQRVEEALQRAARLLKEGADWIDLGGYSSRPGALDITPEEEKQRVLPVLEALKKEYGSRVCVSVDTFRVEVARAALEAGADMINDISGGNEAMWELVAQHRVPYVMMHMRGTPQTMQQMTDYTEGVTLEVLRFFSERMARCRACGVHDIIVDPGFGFAKTLEQNYELLRNLSCFRQLSAPILVGVSRKSMIYKALGITPAEALNGTTALNSWALCAGASILRVHDVKEAKEIVTLFDYLKLS